MKRELFQLTKRNHAQAGKLWIAMYFEDHGYEAGPLRNDEHFDMRTEIDGSYEIVLCGITSGMAKVPLEGMETAGRAIHSFNPKEGGLNEFLSKSERSYTHFVIVYTHTKRANIFALS